MMHGQVGVESTLGQGCVFGAEIPYLPAESAAAKPIEKRPIEHLKAQSSRILVVEDNLINRRIAEKTLEKLGHSVTLPIIALTATTAEEDREKAKQCSMDGFLHKPFQVEEIQTAILNTQQRQSQS